MHQWSTTPINNQSADARAYLVEGSTPVSGINNAIRGAMATAALWRDDNLGAALVATLGANNVYSVVTGQGLVDPTTQVGGATPKITHPFSLRLTFDKPLAGSATNIPHLKVDGVDCGPILRRDGSAVADGDLSTTAPVEVLGDFAASTDAQVTRVRLLARTVAEITALVPSGNPVGTIIYRASRGFTAPNGYLPCNGALVSRTTYAQLWAYAQADGFITTDADWPNHTPIFSTGDGSGTNFRLPDLRGEFLRGLDFGRGVDPSRDPANVQGDQFRYHQHQTVTDGGLLFLGGGVAYFQNGIGQASYASQYATGGAGGNETRPRNVAYPVFIKF